MSHFTERIAKINETTKPTISRFILFKFANATLRILYRSYKLAAKIVGIESIKENFAASLLS